MFDIYKEQEKKMSRNIFMEKGGDLNGLEMWKDHKGAGFAGGEGSLLAT
jgi:hypothetical protein